MLFKRSAILGLLGTMLVVAGCGQTAPGATVASGLQSAGMAALSNGRKLGYDLDRYRDVISKTQKPQSLPRQGMLPGKVDLRNVCAPVYDQGELGSCTAFAIAKGLRETLQRQRNEAQTPLSALFFYYEERKLMGTVGEDSGATIADGMAVLAKKGAAPEADWPYKEAKFTVKPSEQAYANAPRFKAKKTYHLASLEDVKTSLANRNAVALGFEVYSSFDKIGKNGMMPVPTESEKIQGGHAVLAVGYDDAKQVLIVRNSWGAGWADKGYFYMPYKFAASKHVDEYWTAQ